mgnify:CR=1 FL=1|jgi:hypothetical protein
MQQSPFSHDQGINLVQSKKSRFLKINLVLIPVLVILGFVIYHFFIDDETGCDTYASKYSCKYLVDKANYDVYYWANVSNGDPNDDKLVGTVKGLPACLAYATEYNNSLKQKWNERSYVCVLKKAGQIMEKHRYLVSQ